MKKKILIINPQQFGYGAGYYYYCKYLKDSFDIHFICFDKGLNKVNEPGVKVIYLNYFEKKLIRLAKFIYFIIKYSKSTDYNFIFTVYFKLVFLIRIFSKNKKQALDIRTGSLKDNKCLRWLENKIIFISTLFFPKVTILSESLRSKIGISEKKTFILPLGAQEILLPEKSYDRIHLLYVGSLNKRKIETTIEGFKFFYKKYGNIISCRYDIIGFGSKQEEKKIRESINAEGENYLELIQFHGRKNHSELIEYFDKATIGVCFIPKKPYYDIQPSTKIFEYSFAGLITIATNTDENVSVISDKNGVICEDNSYSFFKGLETIYLSLNKYSFNYIKDFYSDYHWEKIVRNILLPLFS